MGGIYHATKAPQGKEGSASDVMPVSKKILTNQDLQRTIQKFKIPLNWHPKHPVRSLSGSLFDISFFFFFFFELN